jgi:hypothetical protein
MLPLRAPEDAPRFAGADFFFGAVFFTGAAFFLPKAADTLREAMQAMVRVAVLSGRRRSVCGNEAVARDASADIERDRRGFGQ